MSKFVWPIISLIIAAGIQGNIPGALSLFGAQPDLILVVLVSYSLVSDPLFGAALGFLAGFMHGSLVGLSMGSFIVTRVITGYLAGLVNTRVFSENPVVPALSALWLTFVCEGLFLLANPQPDVLLALRKVLGECILNAIFAVAMFWLLQRSETHRKIRLANARL